MKYLALILSVVLCSANGVHADAEHPRFVIWRDKGRLHLLTQNLADELYVDEAPNPETGENPTGETFFREDRTGFEFRRSAPITEYGEMARVRIHQNRGGDVEAEWWTDLNTARTVRKFPDLASSMRDSDVAHSLCGAIRDAGQNSDIPTLNQLKFALGWQPRPDRDTREVMLSLIDRLNETDAKRRRLACVELHRLAIYLPAVIEVTGDLSVEQQARINWAMSDMWVDGTTELILTAQAIFLDGE